MKKTTLTALVLTLFGILAASPALAATASLQVTAEVVEACSIGATSLDFGELDPTSGAAATVTGNAATVTCTNGLVYGITDNSTDFLSSGGNQIAYTLTYNGAGTGSGSPQNISITGDIAFTAYQNKPAGVYSETVTLTVTP